MTFLPLPPSPPLGHPLPMHDHAVSVAMPKWSHIVGYEEGCPIVAAALAVGYPRFVYHPYVKTLMSYAIDQYQTAYETAMPTHPFPNVDCIILPSRLAADRCRDFIIRAHYTDSTSEPPSSPCNSTDALSFPSSTTTNSLFTTQATRQIKVLDLETEGCHAIIFPAVTQIAVQAKSYWQHTGKWSSPYANESPEERQA